MLSPDSGYILTDRNISCFNIQKSGAGDESVVNLKVIQTPDNLSLEEGLIVHTQAKKGHNVYLTSSLDNRICCMS